jgi:serine/threonine protein kinase
VYADNCIDIKPGNVLVNETKEAENQQITEVQLADFGSTISQTSGHATDGDDIGTPIFRSPEAQLQMSWTTATDIWSFGIMVCRRSKPTSNDLLTTSFADHRCNLRQRLSHHET